MRKVVNILLDAVPSILWLLELRIFYFFDLKHACNLILVACNLVYETLFFG